MIFKYTRFHNVDVWSINDGSHDSIPWSWAPSSMQYESVEGNERFYAVATLYYRENEYIDYEEELRVAGVVC